MARRRARARESGMCIICCKEKAAPARTVCHPCHLKKAERKKFQRKKNREVIESQQIVAAHEAAGDRAGKRHLFDTAAQYYQEALGISAITLDDRQRLMQKFSMVSTFMSSPVEATAWHGRVLDSNVGDAEKVEKTVGSLARMAFQMWIHSRTQESLELRKEAARIAEKYGTAELRKMAILRLVTCLILLGHFDDAAEHLDSLGSIGNGDGLEISTEYHWRKGLIAAFRGLSRDAYEHLQKATSYAKAGPDFYRVSGVLTDYAIAALALGDLQRARALFEQALLFVRQYRLGWYITRACIDYADILARMSHYEDAHGYLLEALSSDAHAPILEEGFAKVGIPIALHLNDQSTLEKCIRPTTIDLAFQSGEPARIGSVAAAFAHLYAKQGYEHKARTVLHRALELVTYVDESVDLPLAAAQHGARADLPLARALLEKRMSFPSSGVAQACLLLFDAFVAQRTQMSEAPQLAAQAVERFDRLQWYAYSDLARSLTSLPRPTSATVTMRERPLGMSLKVLTERERQVVELALRGSTNRTIAQQLNIREHTVEKHMGSIMTRLGIRSRHQLIGAVGDLPDHQA